MNTMRPRGKRPMNPAPMTQFFCTACNAWLFEAGGIHVAGHHPGREGDHPDQWRTSLDGGRTWKEVTAQ